MNSDSAAPARRPPLTKTILALAAALAALTALCAGRAAADDPQPGGAGQEEFPVAPAPADDGRETPFDRHGMWVWYVDRIEGGAPARIAARAKRAGVGTLYIKSGDGSNYWGQFSAGLVRRLKAAGLDVCAWQFVYGDAPLAEARVAAAAVARGADCFAIDAEGQYEGKYAAADRYVRALRARVGPRYPISLASFPYVDYHPSFPYSVFMGPGGATFNQPQMYWRDIGVSLRTVYEHTYVFNRPYGHPIYPIGQTYNAPGRGGLLGFRRFAESYGGRAPSWWAWHETSRAEWRALGHGPVKRVGRYRPVQEHPVLRRGSRGDLVVWAQMHLRAAVRPGLPVTGIFGVRTRDAVRAFQRERGIRVTGVLGEETWKALLEVEPYRPRWGAPRGRGRARASAAAGPGRHAPGRPLSADLPALAYEIDPGPRP